MKRITFFQDAKGKYRWRLWSSSDIIAASSQGYADAGDAWDNLAEVLHGTVAITEVSGQLLLLRHSPLPLAPQEETKAAPKAKYEVIPVTVEEVEK